MIAETNIWLINDIISLIIIYFLYCVPKWKKNNYRMFLKTCMYIYFCFVMYFTLIIPIIIPLPFINTTFSNTHIILIPFTGIMSGYERIVEIILNILMFIPFGIMYPFIYKKSLKITVILALIIISFIECWQLIAVRNLSYFDITDFINNTLGAIIGYKIYKKYGENTEKLLKGTFKRNRHFKYIVPNKYKLVFTSCLIIQLLIRSITFNY